MARQTTNPQALSGIGRQAAAFRSGTPTFARVMLFSVFLTFVLAALPLFVAPAFG